MGVIPEVSAIPGTLSILLTTRDGSWRRVLGPGWLRAGETWDAWQARLWEYVGVLLFAHDEVVAANWIDPRTGTWGRGFYRMPPTWVC